MVSPRQEVSPRVLAEETAGTKLSWAFGYNLPEPAHEVAGVAFQRAHDPAGTFRRWLRCSVEKATPGRFAGALDEEQAGRWAGAVGVEGCKHAAGACPDDRNGRPVSAHSPRGKGRTDTPATLWSQPGEYESRELAERGLAQYAVQGLANSSHEYVLPGRTGNSPLAG